MQQIHPKCVRLAFEKPSPIFQCGCWCGSVSDCLRILFAQAGVNVRATPCVSVCMCAYRLQSQCIASLFLAGQCVRHLRSAVTAHLQCIGQRWPAGKTRGEKEPGCEGKWEEGRGVAVTQTQHDSPAQTHTAGVNAITLLTAQSREGPKGRGTAVVEQSVSPLLGREKTNCISSSLRKPCGRSLAFISMSPNQNHLQHFHNSL